MKRRFFVFTGAAAMTVGSFMGLSVAAAAPASAAPNPGATVGYIISCVTSNVSNPFALLGCLSDAIHQFLAGLQLPTTFFPFSTGVNTVPSAPALPAVQTPASRLSSILNGLPTALQTQPTASPATVSTPLRQIVPGTFSTSGLTTTSPRFLRLNRTSTASLPKLPSSVPIKLQNIAESNPAPASGSPVSGGDLLALAGLAGIAATTAVTRRRLARR